MSNSLNIFQEVDLTGIMGTGWDPLTDSLAEIRGKLQENYAFVKDLRFTGNDVKCIPNAAGVLNNIDAAGVTISAVAALNTIFPETPTIDSPMDVLKKIQESTIASFSTYFLSDDLLHSNDAEASNNTDVYVKVKEIIVPITGTMRIKFDIRGVGGTAYFGAIYKNGVEFGTVRNDTPTDYQTYSEDLAFDAGDLLQLYVKSALDIVTSYVQNFRIYGKIYNVFTNILE